MMPKAILKTVLLVALMGMLTTAGAQQDLLDTTRPRPGEGVGISADKTSSSTESHYYAWSETQWQMTYGIVAFASVLFICQFAVMFASKDYWSDRQFKAFTLTLLLTTGLILIIAGFTDSQIAPMMGLIGTIAGYVLGTSGTVKNPSDQTKDSMPETTAIAKSDQSQ